MDLGLRGLRAMVTGGSKGIGRAIAEVLAEEGCSLALVSRGAEALEQCAATIRARYPDLAVTTHPCDLSIEAERESLANSLAEIDIVVNNAGSTPAAQILETDDRLWRSSWELKGISYIALCRAAYDVMAKRGSGVIINIIGVAGERLQASYIVGSTGNAALMAFTRTLGSVSPQNGVRVVGINPGLTETERAVTLMRGYSAQKYGTPNRADEIQQEMGLPFGRMATSREVADLAAFLASPRGAYISGTIVTIDGGAAHKH